jgi:hypothetical protein
MAARRPDLKPAASGTLPSRRSEIATARSELVRSGRSWPSGSRGVRSTALSTPTRSPLTCATSWPSAGSWTGSAADLLRASAARSSDGISRDCTGWPKNPRALAGRLRRAQTFLRVLGIDITFSREGRAGNRIIRMRATCENTVSTASTVSSIGDNGAGSAQAAPAPPATTTVNAV